MKTLVKTPVKTSEMITEVLGNNPDFTLAQVAEKIDKSVSAVERATKKLREEGRLKYTGPQKGGYWEILSNE